MDKRDLIIYALILFICITATVLITKHFTTQDIETRFNSRNDSLENANIILTSEAQKLRLDLRDLQQAVLINEIGTEQNRQNFKKRVNEIKKQSSNEDYKNIINYLDTLNFD